MLAKPRQQAAGTVVGAAAESSHLEPYKREGEKVHWEWLGSLNPQSPLLVIYFFLQGHTS